AGERTAVDVAHAAARCALTRSSTAARSRCARRTATARRARCICTAREISFCVTLILRRGSDMVDRKAAIPCFPAVLLLVGCGTLHNEGRFSMAKDASAAFDAAKITEALKDERVQNQAIFD